ncbi:MAG: hypothetical protein DYH12_01785 [Sorangiineae bacterium PRO1]|nr:hypothetical protein [Sorangiineae bacterium PRO1]
MQPPRAKYRFAEGSLWVSFAPFLGVQLRLSSWPDGLELYRQDLEGWVREEMDPQVLNVASVERLPGYHPVRRFAADIPEWARQSARRYVSWQLTVLRLLRHCPAARDLARGAPTLLWLFASAVDRRDVSMPRASHLLEHRRVEVLRWCAGEQASASTLRFLQKFVASYSRGELELLQRALSEPEVVAWFRHEPEVRVGDLRRVVLTPRLRRFRFFREAVAQGEERPELVTELPLVVRDVRRLGAALGRRDVSAVLDRCRTVANLRQLHDRWSDLVNLAAAERRLPDYVERYGSHEFPRAPLPGTESIVPVATVDELAAEGRELRHCVLAHAPAIFEGRAYVYRVLAPERATLEVAIQGSALTLAQLRGARNAKVSEETQEAVLRWLAG